MRYHNPRYGTKKYNFQIGRSKEGWKTTKVHERFFMEKRNAMALAQRAADIYGCEVRVTEGYGDPLSISGTYVAPEKWGD